MLTRLRALIVDADPDLIVFFTHLGAPVSKARARWSRRSGHAYTPAATVTAQESLTAAFLAATDGETLPGAIAIVIGFYRPNFQRIDIDNLTKLVMDAATKARVWPDDCHVVAQACFMELDVDNPRTLVAFCEVPSTLDRSRRFTCRICGVQFTRAGVAAIKHPPQFCSKACRSEDRGQVS